MGNPRRESRSAPTGFTEAVAIRFAGGVTLVRRGCDQLACRARDYDCPYGAWFLWYGPIFGKMWMAGIGKTEEELGSPVQGIVIAGGSTLVMAIAFAFLLTVPDTVNLATGMLFGALIGIGFL